VPGDSHWVNWHQPYEDPGSPLSERLHIVQGMVAQVLDGGGGGGADAPLRVVSLCAGQGRDVIDVVATHPQRRPVSALLVELDPDLVRFARARAEAAGVADQVTVVEGDASLCRLYADDVPADLVLVCGVFGNISHADIRSTIAVLPGFCAPGAHVLWTRHRRPPDATPAIRATFAEAGFDEVAFVAPAGRSLSVGHHRLTGPTAPFDPARRLFDFVGDGHAPA
jgi:hypothetical protein